MDIQGHVLAVLDARRNTAEARTYGMLGQPLEVLSHDAGTRVHLLDALGQPMRSWDDRDQRFSVTHDDLRRPVSVGGGAEKLLSRIVYGGVGVATSLGFDFKGQPLEEQRQLFADKTTQPDWSDLLGEDTIAAMASAAASLLDAETFSASSSRDALGRVLTAYDAKGRILSETEEAGEPLSRLGKHVVERREGSVSTVWAANA